MQCQYFKASCLQIDYKFPPSPTTVVHRNTNSQCNIFKLYSKYFRKMGALVAAVLGSSQWSCLETLFLGMFLLASFWHEPQRGLEPDIDAVVLRPI